MKISSNYYARLEYNKKFEDFSKKASEYAFKDVNESRRKKHKEVLTTVRNSSENHSMKYRWIPRITSEDLQAQLGKSVRNAAGSITEEYTVTKDEGYNSGENSISLVPGTNINLGNGIRLKIGKGSVSMNLDESKRYSDDELSQASDIAGALNQFIRYANGQSGSFGFNDDKRKLAALALRKAGINTNQTFLVNGTPFSTQENAREVLEIVGIEHPTHTAFPYYKMKEIFERYEMDYDWS